MKIILLQDITTLGSKGDVKTVTSGYARNFLIPQKKAVVANTTRLKEFEKIIEKSKQQRLVEDQKFKELSEKISGITVTISEKATQKNQLYGSIDAKTIAEEIEKITKISLDPNFIKLPKSIKKLGSYEITIHFSPTIETTINVSVQASEEKEQIKKLLPKTAKKIKGKTS